LVHLVDGGEFETLLKSDRPLRIKVGFDPTTPDLHLGHAVLLKKMRQFQDAGHPIVLIIGDTTAAIGDPTGRNAARPPLDEETIEANGATYMDQALKILDRGRMVFRNNSEWLKRKPLDEVIELASNFTVQQLLQRDDFKKRIDANQPVHLHELLYPLPRLTIRSGKMPTWSLAAPISFSICWLAGTTCGCEERSPRW